MDEHCNNCGQKDRCQEVYEQLGHSKGPNIAFKAVLAFVVPIAVFVASALLAQILLKNKLENNTLIVLIQLAAGLAAAGVIVLIIRHLYRRDTCRYSHYPQEEKH